MKNMRWAASRAKTSTWQGNGGLQSYNHKEPNSANNLNVPGNKFFPRASNKECNVIKTFISAPPPKRTSV